MNSNIRVRFAPSPTGFLHVGGARTALFNFLYARKMGGSFILRIEDTDMMRSSSASEEALFKSLRWLGLDWDEGPDIGGAYGPYRQSERLPIYQEYAEKLLQQGSAYLCYCTDQELTERRELALQKNQDPHYDGRCKDLTEAQKENFIKEGRRASIRLKTPGLGSLTFTDVVRGSVTFDYRMIGDFIILRSDGWPTYNFAVVIDDTLMKISHVIRAEEHLSNTLRQILLFRALNFVEPEFVHVSLILGKNRSKLSKRHSDTAVEDYQRKGYLPAGLINYLALLGWSPPEEDGKFREILTVREMIQEFSLEKLSKSPAIFDEEKLNWINSRYIKELPNEQILEGILPFTGADSQVPYPKNESEQQYLLQVIEIAKKYIQNFSEFPEHAAIFYQNEIQINEPDARLLIDQNQNLLIIIKDLFTSITKLDTLSYQQIMKQAQKESGLKGKDLYIPFRVALTGRMHGPDLAPVCILFGKEKILKRLEDQIK